jgi:hydrogenase maturation factor HypF (carbamoyltransferase family)
MTVIRHPSYFLLFPRLQIKLNGRHCYTTEVIEAESQVMMNMLTEHDFQDHFKKRQKRWERCMRAEGDYFKCDGGQSYFLTRWQQQSRKLWIDLCMQHHKKHTYLCLNQAHQDL